MRVHIRCAEPLPRGAPAPPLFLELWTVPTIIVDEGGRHWHVTGVVAEMSDVGTRYIASVLPGEPGPPPPPPHSSAR